MANCIFSFPNWLTNTSIAPVAGGGSWLAQFPLSNALDRAFNPPARTNGTSLANTQLSIDMGVARDVRCVAISKSNMTKQAVWRVTGTAVDGVTTVFDTGYVLAFPPSQDFNSLYWGHPAVYDGLPSDEDWPIHPHSSVVFISPPGVVRYVNIAIQDAANPAGYIEINHIFVGAGWVPSVNIAYGASVGIEDESTIQESYSGVDYFSVKQKRRNLKFTLAGVPEDEARTWFTEMVHKLGNISDLFFVWDTSDTDVQRVKSMLCRIRALPSLESSAFNSTSQVYELLERIG